MNSVELAVTALQAQQVIAYPTEGVFGVGCDPDSEDAVHKLLAIKQRPIEKGLILIAAHFDQLKPYIDLSQLSDEQLVHVQSTWPGPVTWVMPASEGTKPWLTGQFDTIAVRVSDHPLVQTLCQVFGKPITSTSANLTGQPACRTTEEVREQLGDQAIYILEGKTNGRSNPSEIRDARTLQILRQG